MKTTGETLRLRGPWIRAGGVIAGIVLTQVILYGPALSGSKILLPLDLLALPWTYLPDIPDYASVEPHNIEREDMVLSFEFERQFTASEFRAGRLPLWTPYQFAGAPFANFPKYSPFTLLYCVFPSPVTVAWIQMALALVAGTGIYLFCRRILTLGYWPSAIAAWCYPMTGFFILYQGFPLTNSVAWLSWSLLATDLSIRRPWGWSAMILAPLTCVILISGQVDAAGHVLLASGIYSLWCLFDEYGRSLRWGKIAGAALSTGLAWLIGILMAAPYLLPLGEYAFSGLRLSDDDAAVVIDRPPTGLSELPRMVLPRIYGTREQGSCHIGLSGSWTESSAATYAGLLATLIAAPLAWRSRRHRSINILLLVLAVFSVSWTLDLPGLVKLFQLPLLNMRSHNRFVFVATFAILSLAAIGLEALRDNAPKRWWLLPAPMLLLVLGGWCFYRSYDLPEPVATEIELAVLDGNPTGHASDLATVHQIRRTFTSTYRWSAALCGLAVAAWCVILVKPRTPSWFAIVLGGMLVAELLWFAKGVKSLSDPSLYYPRIPALVAVAENSNDRILGVDCLPPRLNESHGLREIRGYDSIDPVPIFEVLEIVKDRSFESPHYARLLYYIPRFSERDDGQLGIPGVLSMLNVRYLIFQGEELPLKQHYEPWLHIQDYWVLENPDFLPRAFVPNRVDAVFDRNAVLWRLSQDDFDPRRVAYVDQPVTLPEHCSGSAEIVNETPSHITIAVTMQTPGLVVLADQWDPGWRAELNGSPVQILRTNHALRGVQVPAGRSTLTFDYAPAGFTWGVRLMMLSLAMLAVWILLRFWHIRTR
jgi:hypothetical protein